MTPPSPPPPGSSSTPDPLPSAADPERSAPEAHDLVDRLADGTLDADGRVRLARAMERDPSLRRDVEELERVNARLKACFGPAAAQIRPLTPPRAAGISRRAGLALLAACIVVGGAALAIFFSGGAPEWGSKALALYRSIEAAGFTPEEVCTTPEQFELWTRDNIGEPIRPQLGVAGLELIGWNRSYTFSPYTGVLIAKVDGRGVIVLLDRAAPMDAPAELELGDGLRAFPMKFGDVGAIEVTPFDSPRVVTTLKRSGS